MADVKTQWLSEETARIIVGNVAMHTGEMFPLLLRANRRLMPVTTAEERARNHAYITDPAREIERAQLVPTARGYGVTIPNQLMTNSTTGAR